MSFGVTRRALAEDAMEVVLKRSGSEPIALSADSSAAICPDRVLRSARSVRWLFWRLATRPPPVTTPTARRGKDLGGSQTTQRVKDFAR
jgi:hypothetical protein